MSFTYPIAILSYNRPELLDSFLESLKQQISVVSAANVHLFQDGPSTQQSSTTNDARQRECIDTFRKYFPEGTVHYSEKNLGIALNFDRAEQLFFTEMNAEVGVFFEDDMTLSPHYLTALEPLISFALEEPRIAYVAAYGDHKATAETQARSARKIIPMHHKWGFALTRRQWLAQRPIVDGYLDIVRGKEYTKRDANAIHRYFRSLGYDGPATSQDFVKDIASLVLGTTKVMCSSCYGKYIGVEGTHFTKTLYDKMNFGDTVLRDVEPEKFERPTIAQLERWVDDARKQARVTNESPLPTTPMPVQSMLSNEAASTSSTPVSPPSIRMTPKEIELLIRHLKSSQAYLEFGAGGSTQLAIEHARGRIVTVESDAAWVEKLKADPKVKAAIDARRLSFMHIDIGPVGDWGVPRGETRIKHWKDYFSAPWISLDIPFDLVLIDGRFRIMCALMAAAYASDETRIAIHDYGVRKHYFVIEKYFDTIETADTLVILKRRKNINYMSWSSDILKHFFDFG